MGTASSRARRLRAILGLNIALGVGQAAAGVVAHSTGLLSDAGHNLTDVAGIGVSLLAVRWAAKPRSPERSYGYHRGTILSALVNAAVIAAVTLGIVAQASLRLLHPHDVTGALVVPVAAVAVVLNAISAFVLREKGRDLNMRAAALHMTGDALGSAVVVVAGALIWSDPSLRWADPAASFAIAALILVEAIRIMRASVDVLLESTPADVDLKTLTSAMSAVPGVEEVHDLHVWSISSELRALSAHVMLHGHPSLEDAQLIGEKVKAVIGAPFDINHATLEFECERCVDEDVDPCLIDAPGGADERDGALPADPRTHQI